MTKETQALIVSVMLDLDDANVQERELQLLEACAGDLIKTLLLSDNTED